MRTSEQIQVEIEEKFGFVPPFFGPAQQNPQVLENPWQQTLSSYVNNPLSPVFKEKLAAYLSRFCTIPYCLLSHSCTLRALGMKAREVLELLEPPPPMENDIESHIRVLAQSGSLTVLPEPNSVLEDSLLVCSIFVFLNQVGAERYRAELRQLLGTVNYQHLVLFAAYVKTCHAWIEANPEISYAADKRVIDHLDALVEEDPGLADFFRNYNERVRRERQSQAEHLAELAECRRNEDALTQLKQAESALRSSLATNRALLNAIPDLMFRISKDGTFVNFKAAKDNDLLVPKSEFLGKKLIEVLPHELALPAMDFMGQAL